MSWRNVRTMGQGKYHNQKVMRDGIRFDSKKEADRYSVLKALERGGVISDLRLQVRYDLVPPLREETIVGSRGGKIKGKIIPGYSGVHYYADFVYIQDGETIVEDVKGFQTDVYKIKKQLMAERYGVFIREV